MKKFATKDDLVLAWAKQRLENANPADNKYDINTFVIMGKGLCKYIPFLYCGGWVISHFGYSTERIGRYVSKEKAGDPRLIQDNE